MRHASVQNTFDYNVQTTFEELVLFYPPNQSNEHEHIKDIKDMEEQNIRKEQNVLQQHFSQSLLSIPIRPFLSADQAWFSHTMFPPTYPRPSPLVPLPSLHKSIRIEYYAILFDWLIDVAKDLECSHECVSYAKNYFDQYLASTTIEITHKNVQKIGIVCLWIADKFHDIEPLDVECISYVAANGYSVKEIIEAERDILQVLNYSVFVITPATVAHILIDRFEHSFLTPTLQGTTSLQAAPTLIPTILQPSRHPPPTLASLELVKKRKRKGAALAPAVQKIQRIQSSNTGQGSNLGTGHCSIPFSISVLKSAVHYFVSLTLPSYHFSFYDPRDVATAAFIMSWFLLTDTCKLDIGGLVFCNLPQQDDKFLPKNSVSLEAVHLACQKLYEMHLKQPTGTRLRAIYDRFAQPEWNCVSARTFAVSLDVIDAWFAENWFINAKTVESEKTTDTVKHENPPNQNPLKKRLKLDIVHLPRV